MERESPPISNRSLAELLKLLTWYTFNLKLLLFIFLIKPFLIFSNKSVGIRRVTFFLLCAKMFWAGAVYLVSCVVFFSLGVAVSQSL